MRLKKKNLEIICQFELKCGNEVVTNIEYAFNAWLREIRLSLMLNSDFAFNFANKISYNASEFNLRNDFEKKMKIDMDIRIDAQLLII